MAAVSEYPIGNEKLVRGDPVEIPVNLSVSGTPFDASGFDWRAQIRTGFDGTLVGTFTTNVVVPDGGTIPSQVVLSLTDDEARVLEQGYVFDLEQRDQTTGDTIRTWWIVTRLNVQPDVSYDTVLLAKVVPETVASLR